MDPHEPFLKAIVADRHNDLPRLVYADWLEETAEPANVARAHFIRTQINLEAADPRSDLYHEMKSLEARILDWYLDDWRYELPEFVRYGSDVDAVKWRRGFPDDLGEMSVADFTEYGATALAELPLTALHLSDRTTPIDFERFPALSHVSVLKLGPACNVLAPPPSDDESSLTFDSLMTASVFASLRSLELSENALTDAWVIRFATAFAFASFAPTLETLNLSGNFGITDAGANVLATAAGFDRLSRLHVHDTYITPAGMNLLKKRFGNRVR